MDEHGSNLTRSTRSSQAVVEVGGTAPAVVTAAPRSRALAGHRADLQGLRAVAVLTVVLCHAGVPLTTGGYVGVDVFFVISGFLITRWLLDRMGDGGTLPFAAFYAARARRILPAAALTLVATCVASVALLNVVRALSALRDAAWAAVFLANVHFAAVSTNYFARDDPPSPVQHFWTLAVEEQFYVVWPALLAIAVLALRWRRPGAGPPRRGLAVLLVLGILASLAWSVHTTSADPQAAYFSTAARAWELGVGALIAVGAPAAARIGPRVRAGMSWAGLAGILLATVAYTSHTPFPGDAALLPVLSAALVIAAGVHGRPAGAAIVLGRAPLTRIGDISYSLYLWHWPMLVIAAQLAGRRLTAADRLALVVAALVLSDLTYRVVEDPLRHAAWLRAPGRSIALWPATLVAVLAVAGTAASSLETPRGAPARLDVASVAARPFASAATRRRGSAPRRFDMARRLRMAVASSVTPARLRMPVPRALDPSLGALSHDTYDLRGCEARSVASPICVWGDRRVSRRLVVLGDSHAQMWMPAFVRFARVAGWRLIPLVKLGCVPANLGSGDCAAWYAWALAEVRRLHPGLVVLSQFWSGQGAPAVAGVTTELGRLERLTRRVVVVEDPPSRWQTAVDCLLARGATLGSCTFPIVASERLAYGGVQAAVRASGAGYVRTRQWVCLHGRCPTVVGDIVVYRDSTHISKTYAELAAGPLAAELERAVSPG